MNIGNKYLIFYQIKYWENKRYFDFQLDKLLLTSKIENIECEKYYTYLLSIVNYAQHIELFSISDTYVYKNDNYHTIFTYLCHFPRKLLITSIKNCIAGN